MKAQKLASNPLTDPKALAIWWMQHNPDDKKVSYSVFRGMTDACYELFHYVSKASGIDPRSNQYWVRLAMPKDGKAADALIELGYFLPHIKPTDGYKHLMLTEHTEAEFGTFELREHSEADIRLVKSTYGRESELQRFSSWDAAFEYVRLNHWYGDSDT